MPNASNYDWSLLERDLIAQMVAFAAPAIVSKPLTPVEFTKKVRRLLRFFKIPVHVRTSFNTNTTKNAVWVGGSYFCVPDAIGKTSITILLQFNSLNKKITITENFFRRMCYSVADTVLHEIIHMRQYRRRNFKNIPGFLSTANSGKKRAEQDYLGHDDEIDAYAFNIACQLIDRFKDDTTQMINYLNSDLDDKRRKKSSYRMYLDAFDHNHKHTVIKKLKKKIMRYLPNAAEIGKPYKTNDWLKT
jgi:hypothetical protein